MAPIAILKKGKAKPFWHGESIIFSGAIDKIQGNPKPAELVQVYDAGHKLIGFGVFNPYSNYRIRLLSFSHEKLKFDLEDILSHRLNQALKLRRSLGLPNGHTDSYRFCNSEGDYLSGIIIDVFSEYAVVYVTAYWAQLYSELIKDVLKKKLVLKDIYWRPQLKALMQDGWNIDKSSMKSSSNKTVVIRENDVLFQVDLAQGQKTGFYFDQRDNRYFIRKFCKDRTVLDCYCYTGGFALNAAFAGAKRVLGVDSSQPAIELANINADLNKLKNVSFKISKAIDILANADEYDFIILDPPKLAPSKKNLFRATQHYLQLNEMALKILPTNGLLLTCSCSDAMNKEKFLATLQLAAKNSKKKIQIIKVTGAAADHPINRSSLYGDYLKAVLLQVI